MAGDVNGAGKALAKGRGRIRGTSEAVATAFEQGAVKWHPGIYSSIARYMMKPSGYATFMADFMDAATVFRGMQMRTNWRALEPNKDEYNYSEIDTAMAYMSARGKRLVVMLQIRSFILAEHVIPDYLMTPEYDMGDVQYLQGGNPKGWNLALWNDKVMERLKLLFTKLAERYNDHTLFEAISMSETATGNYNQTAANKDLYYVNLMNTYVHARQAFSKTMVMNMVNFPANRVDMMTDIMSANGIALSGPDTWLTDYSVNRPDGVYPKYRELEGVVPRCPSIQHANFENTEFDETGDVPTVQELIDFDKNQLKANYIFISRNPDYRAATVAALNSAPQLVNIYGGLDPTPPSCYASVFTG